MEDLIKVESEREVHCENEKNHLTERNNMRDRIEELENSNLKLVSKMEDLKKLLEEVTSEVREKKILTEKMEVVHKETVDQLYSDMDKYNNEKTEILKNMKKYEEEARIHEVKIFQYYNFVQKNGY